MLLDRLNKILSTLNCFDLTALINEVIDRGDKDELDLLKKVHFALNIQKDGKRYELGGVTLMMYVIVTNDDITLEKMIRSGFDCNIPLTKWNGQDVRVSPLMCACLFQYTKMAAILLNHNANFSGYYLKSYNLLETIATTLCPREIIDLVINHAKNTGRIKELLSYTIIKGTDVVMEFTPLPVMGIFAQVIFSPTDKSVLTLEDLKIFTPLIQEYNKSINPAFDVDNTLPFDPSFFQMPLNASQKNKKVAIKEALSTYGKILAAPLTCCTLLQKLEKSFTAALQRRFSTRNLKDLTSTEYTLESHVSIKWPVPTPSYVPLKLNSLLSLTIIEELQKFGFGRASYKWYGFVNDEIASENIANGAYITENTMDISALRHGKYSHSIQLLILMYAIEDNLIDMSYGEGEKLDISDLLLELVTPSSNEEKPWSLTNDALYLSKASFSGPHFLQGTLMVHGHKYGLPNLEHALKNSFCKALIRTMQFHNKYHRSNFSSPKDFWDNFISLTNPTEFLSMNIKSHFFRQSHSKRSEERLTPESAYLEGYIVSKKC